MSNFLEAQMNSIDPFARVAVLCIGDVMLDRFIIGMVNRVSPESPVPVLSVRKRQAFPGGAANVARNIAALGGRCTLVGVIGADSVGEELEAALADIVGIDPILVRAEDRPTTEKVRFVAHGQQLLRADQEEAAPLSSRVEARLLADLASLIDGHHVMVLSDYAKGVLTRAVVQGAIALARSRHVPVIVDPKSADLTRYAGASIVTPNAKEVHLATGIDPTEDDLLAQQAGAAILKESGIESVLVTRAHNGMSLISRTAAPVHLPARAREVFDVAGAGDTVVATLALAIGAGQDLADAALVANAAAGIVVGKRGTATVSPRELSQELARISHGHLAPVRGKIVSLAELLEQAHAWRCEGHVIGLVSGEFDAIGAQQVSQLSLARSQCDKLIVGLLSDATIERLHGGSKPLNSEADRQMLLAAFNAVDAVVLFDDETSNEVMRTVAPRLLQAEPAPRTSGTGE